MVLRSLVLMVWLILGLCTAAGAGVSCRCTVQESLLSELLHSGQSKGVRAKMALIREKFQRVLASRMPASHCLPLPH